MPRKRRTEPTFQVCYHMPASIHSQLNSLIGKGLKYQSLTAAIDTGLRALLADNDANETIAVSEDWKDV